MFTGNRKNQQQYLISLMTRLEFELARLNGILDRIQVEQGRAKANARAMDYELEIHALDIEYLKANTKTKKKGNK
jgi:hypothetical protein